MGLRCGLVELVSGQGKKAKAEAEAKEE